MARPRELTPVDFARANQVHSLPVSDEEIFFMFANILNDPALFADARRLLRPDYFDLITEPHYRIFWVTVLQFMSRYSVPHYHGLQLALREQLRLDPMALSAALQERLLAESQYGLLYYCAFLPADQRLPRYGRDILQRLLQERAVLYPFRDAVSQGGSGSYLSQFNELLDAVNAQTSMIATLQQRPLQPTMPQRGEPLPAPIALTPTGVDFIDSFIRGQRVGDCNGILGVFGSGKTTLAIQLSVANAKSFFTAGMAQNQPGKISVLVSYEEPKEKLIRRVWSNACQIRYSKMENLTDWSELSTQDTLEDYERRLCGPAAPGSLILSETERWDLTSHWLNQCFHLIDMSGGEDNPGAGCGYVDELASALERIRLETGRQIGAVHIDYAKLMCERYMQATGEKNDAIRHYIGQLGDQLRRKIGDHFGCTVWLFHQFAGDQSKRSPTHLMHHMDASESKSFAEHLACCGCLGVMDKTTGCVLFNWSKNRYNANHGRAMPVLQIDGEFRRLVDVSHRYVPDAQTHRFIDPSTRYMIQGHHETSNPVSNGPEGGLVDTFL